MQDGKNYVINFGNLAFNKIADSLVFDVNKVRSEAIHVNQAGYHPNAARKYAYISHWMGDLGPLDLDSYNGIASILSIFQMELPSFQGTLYKGLIWKPLFSRIFLVNLKNDSISPCRMSGNVISLS